MKIPQNREELKKQMADLTKHYDELLAKLDGLEAAQAEALDNVDPDKLLEAAERETKRAIAIQVHQAALASLERQFDALATKAVEHDRRWCQEQLAARQPELDKQAGKIAQTLAALEDQLQEYHDLADVISTEVILTPRLTFSREFLATITNALEWYEKELT